MEKDAYKILGVEKQSMGNGNHVDFLIKGKFKAKISDMLNKVNEILDSKLDKDYTVSNKLSEINTEIQSMFSILFAYMKVMTQEKREEYESAKISTVKEDIENMRANLQRSIKIEQRRSKDDNVKESNAYQILGLLEQEEALSDAKVARITLMNIQIGTPKKIPQTTEEIANMLFLLQGGMWAYSKINTLSNRKNYQEELSCQRISQESKEYDSTLGTIRREKFKNYISVPIHQTAEGETFSLVQIGRIINRGICMDEGSTNQYVIERICNGDKSHIMFYGNINMEKLKIDSKYREFWKSILFSENTISFSRKYMGGYIGEAKSTLTEVEGEKQEVFTIIRKPQQVAICKKYYKDREIEKRNNTSFTAEQPQGGEVR
jgi:hypothetical protein